MDTKILHDKLVSMGFVLILTTELTSQHHHEETEKQFVYAHPKNFCLAAVTTCLGISDGLSFWATLGYQPEESYPHTYSMSGRYSHYVNPYSYKEYSVNSCGSALFTHRNLFHFIEETKDRFVAWKEIPPAFLIQGAEQNTYLEGADLEEFLQDLPRWVQVSMGLR